MKNRFWLLLVAMLFSSMVLQAQTIPPTPDIFASATGQIRAATQTAQAEMGQPVSSATQDPFILTATELVRQATGTAERLTGATAAPVVVTSDQFELTATALIIEATQNAIEAGVPAQSAESDGSALPAALFMVIMVIVILLVVGVVLISRRHNRKRGV